jgi:exopolysaccharide production protein ExoZ
MVRIMPLWWIALAVWIAVMVPLSILPAPDAQDAGLSALLIPHERYDGAIGPYYGLGWTLSYELFFYAVFGIAMWFGDWRLAVLMMAVASFGIGFMALEFVAGMLLAWAVKAGIRPNPMFSLLGLALFFVPFDGDRAITWGIPAVCLIAGLVGLELRGRMRESRPLALLGDASYSIYLFHLIPIGISEFWLPQLPALASVSLLMVSGVTFGVMVHLTVERPLLRVLQPLPVGFRRLRAPV